MALLVRTASTVTQAIYGAARTPWGVLAFVQHALVLQWSVPLATQEPNGPVWADDLDMSAKTALLLLESEDDLTDSSSCEEFREDEGWSSEEDNDDWGSGAYEPEDAADNDAYDEAGQTEHGGSFELWGDWWFGAECINDAGKSMVETSGLEGASVDYTASSLVAYAMPSMDPSAGDDIQTWVDKYGSSGCNFVCVPASLVPEPSSSPNLENLQQNPDLAIATSYFIVVV